MTPYSTSEGLVYPEMLPLPQATTDIETAFACASRYAHLWDDGTVGGTGSEVPGATLNSEEFEFPEYIIGEGGSLHPLRRVSPKKNKKSNKR